MFNVPVWPVSRPYTSSRACVPHLTPTQPGRCPVPRPCQRNTQIRLARQSKASLAYLVSLAQPKPVSDFFEWTLWFCPPRLFSLTHKFYILPRPLNTPLTGYFLHPQRAFQHLVKIKDQYLLTMLLLKEITKILFYWRELWNCPSELAYHSTRIFLEYSTNRATIIRKVGLTHLL